MRYSEDTAEQAAATDMLSRTAEPVGLLGYLLVRVVKGKTVPMLFLPVIGLALVALLANLPGQIKKLSTADGSSETRPV